MKYNYSNITVLQFQQIHRFIEDGVDNEFRFKANIMSILSDEPLEKWMEQTNVKQLNEAFSDVNFLTMPDKFEDHIEIKGESFKIVKNPLEWSTYNFATMSELTKNKELIISNMHRIMAAMTDNGKPNTPAEKERRQELFLHIPIGIVHPTAFFFAALLVGLSHASSTSLVKRMRKTVLRMRMKKIWSSLKRIIPGSMKNGDGMLRLRRSVKETG